MADQLDVVLFDIRRGPRGTARLKRGNLSRNSSERQIARNARLELRQAALVALWRHAEFMFPRLGWMFIRRELDIICDYLASILYWMPNWEQDFVRGMQEPVAKMLAEFQAYEKAGRTGPADWYALFSIFGTASMYAGVPDNVNNELRVWRQWVNYAKPCSPAEEELLLLYKSQCPGE